MKKRLLVIAAILVAVLGALVLIFALLPARPGVTKANFDRLENGISRGEVEKIFGEKCSENIRLMQATNELFFVLGDPRYQAWQGEDGWAAIEFNENGQIVEKTWIEFPTSFWQRLHRWLPWLPD